MRERPMRTLAATAQAMRGSRRNSELRLGAIEGLTFSRIAMRSWLIGAGGPLVGGLRLAQCVDRSLQRFGERRGIEVTQHRARSLPVRRTRPALPAMSTKNPSGERGTASSASRRLHARSCDIAQSSCGGDMLPVLSW